MNHYGNKIVDGIYEDQNGIWNVLYNEMKPSQVVFWKGYFKGMDEFNYISKKIPVIYFREGCVNPYLLEHIH